MGIFKKEKRTENTSTLTFDNMLLQAILNQENMTKEKAMQIPAVSGSINLIADIIASTPIRLYEEKEVNGDFETEQVSDVRVDLLNESTGDSLNANEMWRALIRDYYLGQGAYIYINKERGKVKSLHYVDEEHVQITDYIDPIFKGYDIAVLGQGYLPHQFIKILRNTKNGANGISLIKENALILSVAYCGLVFENALVKKGGNKKGFIKSENKLSEPEMDLLKSSWKKLYSNNEENVVVLNKGLSFNESSNTSLEMQLNQNKVSNNIEISKLFHISPALLDGTSSTVKPEEEMQKFVKMAISPLMKIVEAAINEDLLLEKEKNSRYFAFDTKELLKGSAKERFATYKTAIDSKVLTIDEARYMEDLKPLGLDFINLGLGAALFNPDTKELFIANTSEVAKLDDLEKKGGEEEIED